MIEAAPNVAQKARRRPAGASGELFGEQRFAALLDGADDRRPEPLIERAIGAVDAFAAGREQADDITMLALRYLGGG